MLINFCCTAIVAAIAVGIEGFMLRYKGYTADIQYDPEDKILFGTVLDTNDEILFDAKDTEEIEKEFHLAIDDYLEMCEEIGKEPDKPFSGKFNLRLPPDLHKQVSNAAHLAHESMNTYIVNTLRKQL